MSTLLNVTPYFIRGFVEPPVIPGFEIHSAHNDWLKATGRRKEWFVGQTETHWIFTQAVRIARGPHKGELGVEDRCRVAVRKCGTCHSYGYIGETLCPCESGQELYRRTMGKADALLGAGKITPDQYRVCMMTPRSAELVVAARRRFVDALGMERQEPDTRNGGKPRE